MNEINNIKNHESANGAGTVFEGIEQPKFPEAPASYLLNFQNHIVYYTFVVFFFYTIYIYIYVIYHCFWYIYIFVIFIL